MPVRDICTVISPLLNGGVPKFRVNAAPSMEKVNKITAKVYTYCRTRRRLVNYITHCLHIVLKSHNGEKYLRTPHPSVYTAVSVLFLLIAFTFQLHNPAIKFSCTRIFVSAVQPFFRHCYVNSFWIFVHFLVLMSGYSRWNIDHIPAFLVLMSGYSRWNIDHIPAFLVLMSGCSQRIIDHIPAAKYNYWSHPCHYVLKRLLSLATITTLLRTALKFFGDVCSTFSTRLSIFLPLFLCGVDVPVDLGYCGVHRCRQAYLGFATSFCSNHPLILSRISPIEATYVRCNPVTPLDVNLNGFHHWTTQIGRRVFEHLGHCR